MSTIGEELAIEQLIELRQKQFQMAMDGDVRMLIWLGKQYLNQKDSPEVVVNDLCDGFDLVEIKDTDQRPFDKIVFAECEDENCKCKDCDKRPTINMEGI